MPTAIDLRCEYLINPLGLGERTPRLSWRMDDDRPGAGQTAYQVQAAHGVDGFESAALWDSGKVESDQSTHVDYGGEALGSAERVHWRVRLWDGEGTATDWSAPAWFETNLLEADDWQAQWIGGDLVGSTDLGTPSPMLRRDFAVAGEVSRARLYVTAVGLYECSINGERVGDEMLAPGWTDYHERVPVRAYDVTAQVKRGDNAIGAVLADGWAVGHLGFWGRQKYVDRPMVLAQLVIDDADGNRQVVATDGDWQLAYGPIVKADLYNGESYDGRQDKPGWDTAGYDTTGWRPAVVFADFDRQRTPACWPPIRRVMTLRPVDDERSEAGLTGARAANIYDFGQNLVGWVRVKVSGKAGACVIIRHGEMLDEKGGLYTENLRGAEAIDRYTLRGDEGGEAYEPRFTFHGFRYVSIASHGQVKVESIEAVVLCSDLEQTGQMETSDGLVNRLLSNIRWGQRGNYLDVPTDCPQRDERLGWTGDAQVFVNTATYNMQVAPFFAKYQMDLTDGQGPKGHIPCYAPYLHHKPGAGDDSDGGPAWADAFIVCPHTMYRRYGDTRLIRRYLEPMRRWVDCNYAETHDGLRADTRWRRGCGFGDWLATDAPDHNPGATPTPKGVIGTAYLAHSARLLAEMAGAIGRDDVQRECAEIADTVTAAFQREYVTDTGRVLGHTQTSYLLALGFDMLPEALRPEALEHLVRDIQFRGWKLSTGFVGTPLLGPVLTRFGRTDVAYRLLHQEQYPGWLFTIHQGATTMWERWNSYTRDKGFGNVGMNSFNHYAYGAIGEWLYATVAGIDTDPVEVGYKRSRLRPQPGGKLTWATASLDTAYGKLACGWRIEGEKLALNVTVPPNTTAELTLPNAAQETVELAAGDHAFTVDQPVVFAIDG